MPQWSSLPLLIVCDVCSTLDLSDCGSEDLFVCCLTYLINRPRVYNNNYFTESTKTHPRPHFTGLRHGTHTHTHLTLSHSHTHTLSHTHTQTLHTHVVLSSHLECIAITSFLTYFFLCFPAPCSCCHCISDTPLAELKMEKTITPQH